jgi:DNA-nicking Smr family endonuclease
MDKHETFRSFQDLDALRFRKLGDIPGDGVPAKKPAAAAPAVEDESALFLDAVSGSLDVSLKHTPADADTPVPRDGKNKKRLAVPAEASPPPQAEGAAAPPEKPEGADLFAKAMGGVRPIRAGGRDLAPPSGFPEPARARPPAEMDDISNGAFEFSLEYTDEFVQGRVLGLEPVAFEKLKAGAYGLEGHVDLHGQNMNQAYATLVAFIKHAYRNGKRHLIVVTGRGKNSPGGTPVLRERVQAWFTRDPFKRIVLGFCSAKPGDGGAGALYVLLRKRKKSRGKIVWNTIPSEEELVL